MKKIYTFIAATLIAATIANATVRTVNNNGLGGAQYTDIPAAITASSNNDTIYVSGSSSNYSNFTINKRLTIIGPGSHIGGNTQNTQGVFVQNIYIDSTAINQSSTNIKIMGIRFAYIDISHGRNVIIERCEFYSASTNTSDCNGTYFRGCSFDRFQNNAQATNNPMEFSNCVYRYADYLTPNTIVNHSIIIGQSYSIYWRSNGTVFTNSIFYNTNFNGGAHTACVFTNNLVYNITQTAFTLPLSGSTGSNNQAAVDPLFISTIPTNGISNWNDIFNYNWRLATTSPGDNAASDGTDLGVYGGILAINQIGLLPAIPQVNEINIGNAAVPQNGTLNVTFKARKQN